MVNNKKLKIAICIIIKDENDYMEEWLNHHIKLGIIDFVIYDNLSIIPIKETLKDFKKANITIIDWKNDQYLSQSTAYLDCCNKYKNVYDYIIFIDADEYLIISKYSSIQGYLSNFIKAYGNFTGFGISWRIYGNPKPYFETKRDIKDYIYYYKDTHIKSILDPKKVESFPDPHFAKITSGRYINEHNEIINGPKQEHTSNNIWIKHIYTRSLEEFKNKIAKVDVNTRIHRITDINDFYKCNDKCILL